MKDIAWLSYGKIIKLFIHWKFLRENESWAKLEKKKKKKEKEKRKKKNGPCTPVELRGQDLAVQLTIW